MEHPLSLILQSKGSKVFHVKPSDSVADAIHLMNENNIGAVLVMDGEKLCGIFSERDVLRKACFKSLDDMQATTVSHMMTGELETGTAQTTIEEAMRFFTEKRCRHLPILEGNKLIGLVSAGDVTKWIIEHLQEEVSQLSDYISGDLHK